MSFLDCFATLCADPDASILSEFAVICWKIWWARNEVIWNQHAVPAGVVLHQSLEFLDEWRSAQQCRQHTAPPPAQQSGAHGGSFDWQCYTDAAIFVASRSVGSGSVTCRSDGTFLHAFTSYRPGCFGPRIAEALALRLALEQVVSRCNGPGVVFTDAQCLVFSLRSGILDWSEFGAIIQDCRLLLEQRPDIRVSWVRRSDNCFAHKLARFSLSFSQFQFFQTPPSCILHFF